MTEIPYIHDSNVHALSGPRAALPQIIAELKCQSILDVGCGIGTWLMTAAESSVNDLMGIDGVDIPKDQLLFPAKAFKQINLETRFELNRSFDLAICLEVAEHLDASYSSILIDNLTRHSDTVLFSAACPGQIGQHHVNCQWPEYWQKLFNEKGYSCCDSIRWKLWDDQRVDPWYRQNIFFARRDENKAGKENRIKSVIHPDFMSFQQGCEAQSLLQYHSDQLAAGKLPLKWYMQLPFKGLRAKIIRRLLG